MHECFRQGHFQDSAPHRNVVVALVRGILAHGAVGHVISVALHLDGSAVEAELGLQELGSFL